MWVRVLKEGRGRRPRQGLQLRRAWPGKDRGRPSVRSRGPGSQTALLGPWGRPQLKVEVCTLSLRGYRGEMGQRSRRYLPCNRQAASGDQTLESEVMGCDGGVWGALAHHECGSHRLRTNLPARPRAHASPDPLLAVGGSKSPHGWVRPGDPHILKRRRPEARRPEAPLSRRQVPRDPHASQGTGSEPGAALGSKTTCGLRSPLGSVSPWAGEGADHVPGTPLRGLTRGAPRPDGAGERRRQSRQCGKTPVSADGPGYVQMVWNPRRNVDKTGKNRLQAHSDGGNEAEAGLAA